MRKWTSPWAVASVLCLVACGDGGAEEEALAVPEIRALTAQLVKAESCEDLLSEIQADAVSRVDELAELLKNGEQGNSFPRGPAITSPSGMPGAGLGSVPVMAPSVAGADPVAQSAAPAAPTPGAANPSGGDGDDQGTDEIAVADTPDPNEATEEVAGPSGYADTNRQVAEVDEADLVKVDRDGRFIYLLHGDRLEVLKSWPVDEAAVEHEVVLTDGLGGQPYEMFVKDGRAVVFSAVSDSSSLRALGQDSERVQAPTPASSACFDCGYSDRSFTKVTVVDATGDQPQVSRELYFDGVYVSSRRYDERVRAVIRGGFKAPTLYNPVIEYTDPWGKRYEQEVIDAQIAAFRERTVASILATELDDWLPQAVERVDDELVALERDCANYYIPAPGLVSYGMTSVVEFSMAADDGPIGGAMVLGNADEVYSNATTLVVAHRDYRYGANGESGERTVLHQFALGAEGGVNYEASGFVSGRILNQFSMDVRADVLRVTTVEEGWDQEQQQNTTDNRLRTFRVKGKELELLGETPNLGKPNELIQSTRFVDDMAYVVTYERIDPLVVVSLKEPKNPRVLGKVEIPGFSTYMHPLDDGHLLTIGEFVDPQDGGNRALQLQIFDVSDPTDPQQQESYVFSTGGNSLASQEHKAFNYYADKGLLAFPYVDWNGSRSTLEVFRVSLDDGFTRLGSIDHVAMFENCYRYPEGVERGDIPPRAPMAPLPQGADEVDEQLRERIERQNLFYACPDRSVRRGVFVDEYVWSFSGGGALAHRIEDLSLDSDADDAVARIDLFRPLYTDWSGDSGGWDGAPFGGGIRIGITASPPQNVMSPPVPDVMPEVGNGAPKAIDGGVGDTVEQGMMPTATEMAGTANDDVDAGVPSED